MFQRIYNIILALFILFFMWYIYSDTQKQKDENVEMTLVDSVTSNPQISSSDSGGEAYEDELAVALQQELQIVRKGQEMLLKELEEKERELAREKRENRAKEEAFEEELMEEERAIREAREKAEREVKEKALAERQAKEQSAKDKAIQLGALFGNTDSSEGGNASGTKGTPVGHGSGGSIGSISWSLDGRGLRGELPKPSGNYRQEGTVKVAITVDKEGNVIAAKAIGGTVSDETTRQIAVKAAFKAKFTETDRPDKQMGAITYTFKFQ